MAKGKPFLATWGDNTLRTYELSERGFVQIGTISHSNSVAGYPPNIFFVRDSEFIVADRSTSSARYVHVYDKFMRQMYVQSWFSNTASAILAYSPVDERVILLPNSTALASSPNYGYVQGDGTISLVVIRGNAPATNVLLALAFSPDARFLVRGHSGGANRSGYFSDPLYSSSGYTYFPNVTPINIIEWSADSRFVLLGNKTGIVEVWKSDAQTLYKVGEITDELGYPVAIAFAPNLRIVAISYQTTGTPTTVIYRRSGNYFQKIQTLEGTFGTLLDFTADSRYLIDAANRRAFEYVEGSFVDVSHIMQNVAAGATVQAISTHVDSPTGVSKLYDAAVATITQDQSIISRLKVALLNESSVFNQTHSTLDQVTNAGVYEVYGNGWPQGGKPLDNGQWQSLDASSLSATFDDVSQIIIGDTLRFRNAVIYDSVSLKPLIFIEFPELQRVEKDFELKLTFDPTGLIVYSS